MKAVIAVSPDIVQTPAGGNEAGREIPVVNAALRSCPVHVEEVVSLTDEWPDFLSDSRFSPDVLPEVFRVPSERYARSRDIPVTRIEPSRMSLMGYADGLIAVWQGGSEDVVMRFIEEALNKGLGYVQVDKVEPKEEEE